MDWTTLWEIAGITLAVAAVFGGLLGWLMFLDNKQRKKEDEEIGPLEKRVKHATSTQELAVLHKEVWDGFVNDKDPDFIRVKNWGRPRRISRLLNRIYAKFELANQLKMEKLKDND